MEAHEALEPWSFRRFMDDAKDAAVLRESRSTGRLPGRVTWKRPPLVVWRSVAEVADELGVSHARVKTLAAMGRLGRARKDRTRKAHPWLIPAQRNSSGGYSVQVTPATRGQKMRFTLSQAEEVPVDVPF